MSLRGICCALVVVLGSCASAAAVASAADTPATPTYDLSSSRAVGDTDRVTANLEVGGELKLKIKNKIERPPMSVVANLVYDEQLLSLPTDGPSDQAGSRPLRSIRYYSPTSAVIKIGKGGVKPALREERRLLGMEANGPVATLFSPQGPLTREELDLVHIVGNTLVLDLLLPIEPQAIGQSWKHPPEPISALLGLDAIAESTVESTLVEVENGVACVALAGAVRGAAEGVSTDIELKARYHFDLTHRRIVGMTLAVKENRSVGHVAPGLDVVAKLKLQIAPTEAPPQLSPAALSDAMLEANPATTLLHHASSDGGYEVSYDRRWYVITDEASLVVLRLVDRGDLVAQCNLSPVIKRSPERRPSLADYQRDVQYTLGKSFGQFVRSGEWTDNAGQLVYRTVAEGQVEKLPIEWRYYLLAHKNGRRVAAAFTVEADMAERLGDLDHELVSSIRLHDGGTSASEPAENTDPKTAPQTNAQTSRKPSAARPKSTVK